MPSPQDIKIVADSLGDFNRGLLTFGASRAQRDANLKREQDKRRAVEENLWVSEKHLKAQRDWTVWINDANNRNNENLTGEFIKQFDQFKLTAAEGAPSKGAIDAINAKYSQMELQLLGNVMRLEAGTRAQNTINRFNVMHQNSVDALVAGKDPSFLAISQGELLQFIDDANDANKIDDKIAISMREQANNLAGVLAEALLPTNPELAGEVLKGAESMDWPRRRAIQKQIAASIETHDFAEAQRQKQLLAANVAQIEQTGQSNAQFDIDDYLSIFNKDRKEAALNDAERQVRAAQRLFDFRSDMHGKSALDIRQILSDAQPKRDTATFVEDSAIFSKLQQFAEQQIKLIESDPALYSRQDPIVAEMWEALAELPDDTSEEDQRRAVDEAVTISLDFQDKIGIPDGLQSVLTRGQAETVAASLNSSDPNEVVNGFNSLMSTYGRHYPEVFRDMARLPKARVLDPTMQIVALHINESWVNDFIQAARTDVASYSFSSEQLRAFREEVFTDANVAQFKESLTASNPELIDMADQFGEAVLRYGHSLFARGVDSTPEKAIRRASELIIESAYGFGEVNDVRYAIRRRNVNAAGEPINFTDDDISRIGSNLERMLRADTLLTGSEIFPAATPDISAVVDDSVFHFPENISEETRLQGIRDSISRSAAWITTPDNTGVILMLPGLNGEFEPLRDKAGNEIVVGFESLALPPPGIPITGPLAPELQPFLDLPTTAP